MAQAHGSFDCTWQTIIKVATDVHSWVFHGRELSQDRRSFSEKLRGVLGYPIGLVSGVGWVLGESIGSVLINMFLNASRITKAAANIVLHADDQFTMQNDLRSGDDKVMGFFGFPIGVVLGFVAMMAIGPGRMVTNTLKNAANMIIRAANLVLHTDDQFQFVPKAGSSLLGVLGYPIAMPLSVVVMIGLGVGRVFTNTLKNAAAVVLVMSRAVLNPVDQIGAGWDSEHEPLDLEFGQSRDSKDKWLGLFGVPIGVVLGIPTVTGIAVGRVISNTAKSLVFSAVAVVNAVLPRNDQILQTSPSARSPNERRLGFAGLFVGLFVGLPIAAVVAGVRVLSQTLKSSLVVAGALMNVAMARPLFNGINDDKRQPNKKVAGALGYVVGAAVTAPVVSVAYALKQLPTFIGLGASPLVVLLKIASKSVNLARGKTRFSTSTQAQQRGRSVVSIEQKFKNLYSALNSLGRFNLGAALPEGADGAKNSASFFRKCMTLNRDTPTEYVLEQLWKRYQRSGNRTSFFVGAPGAASGYVEVQDEILNHFIREVDRGEARAAMNFIVRYMNAPVHVTETVPENLYPVSTSVGTLFFHPHDDVHEYDADSDEPGSQVRFLE